MGVTNNSFFKIMNFLFPLRTYTGVVLGIAGVNLGNSTWCMLPLYNSPRGPEVPQRVSVCSAHIIEGSSQTIAHLIAAS